MAIHKLTPIIYTRNFQETIDFYLETLGFTCTAKDPSWGWAKIRLDNVELMISLPNDHIPFDKSIFTGSFYFYTENVDDLWHKLKDTTNLCYPLENFDYGMREFAIYDNNGYMLQFGQEI